MPTITVTVPQDHIDRGERQNGESCPVALAITRRMPKWTEVDVGETMFTFVLPSGERDTSFLPEEACHFIASFDAGKPVEPFTFALDRCEEGTGI